VKVNSVLLKGIDCLLHFMVLYLLRLSEFFKV